VLVASETCSQSTPSGDEEEVRKAALDSEDTPSSDKEEVRKAAPDSKDTPSGDEEEVRKAALDSEEWTSAVREENFKVGGGLTFTEFIVSGGSERALAAFAVLLEEQID